MSASDRPKDPTLVVGIGASAGGIEACGALLGAVPPDCGIAFIVVLHLDPSRASHLAEILQGRTESLSVVQANGTLRMKAGCVYVIAPNSKLQIQDGTLAVESLGENEPRSRLVDYLFASLAEADGSRSVGVVLSGGGSDGTEGLRQIDAEGGLCLAQEPSTAAAGSMPRAAIEAGVIHGVLRPAEIAAAVAAFAADGTRPVPPRRNAPGGAERPGEPEDDADFQRIFDRLGAAFEVNFRDYKAGTLARRTRRRMHLLAIDDWRSYADRLDDPDELDALYRDLLIGVTSFFRDPPTWEQLGAELPAMAGEDRPSVRAWVPGCATGEEAYSVAILLLERLPAQDRPRVQVYATDVNERALAIARRGIYRPEALEPLSAERRQRWFRHRDGHLQIERRVRDCVTFAPHNVLTDPPFSRMDLVSCRNLLIYLKPQAHDRLLRRFHFALRAGGLLVLGRSEALGRQGSLFEEVSKGHGIYRARDIPQRVQIAPRRSERIRGGEPQLPSAPAARPRPAAPERRIEQLVLRDHTPACVVVNGDLEIRHFFGRTDRYLVPPTGESRQDLLAWVRPGLHLRLGSAVREAARSGEPLAVEGQIDRDGDVQRVECTIEALPTSLGADGLFLVTFRDTGPSALRRLDEAQSHEPVVRELEQELIDTRRELQGTIDQFETADEEHRAGQEELQSINEELQSSNEELEASKEELEALNEEMNTINRELEEKNHELRAAHNDLSNLFMSTHVPTVFLDRDLQIRSFTPTATDLLRLVPSDVGRSIDHIKERFAPGATAETSRRVLRGKQPAEDEVATDDGRWYVRRVVPYRTDEGTVDGVCITFADVTAQKRVARASEAAQAYAEEVIAAVRSPILVLDSELRVASSNRSFAAMSGGAAPEVGIPLSAHRNELWNVATLDPILRELLSRGTEVNDFEVVSRGQTILVNARLVRTDFAEDRIVVSFEDVTAERSAQGHVEARARALEHEADRKNEWIAMLGHELRNPLGAVANGIALLQQAALPAPLAEIVEMAARQGSHLRRLLDDLLDAARIASGRLEIDREPVDLVAAARLAVESALPQFRDGQVELGVALPPERSIFVRGDAGRLTEVVANLLVNAAKYTPAGGRAELEVGSEGAQAKIRVTDTGIGLASELLPHVFETFSQGPRAPGRAGHGLGLGLPIVREIVRLHGGKVEASSAGAGHGSRFTVTLPRIEDEPLGSGSGAGAEPERTGASAPRRILVVDDQADAATSLRLLLAQRGHETQTAGDGNAALEIARDFKPEIALLDLGLPHMDGYELAQRLRTILPGAVLVAVTGYQKDEARLHAAGFDHHLQKPIDFDQLDRLLADAAP